MHQGPKGFLGVSFGCLYFYHVPSLVQMGVCPMLGLVNPKEVKGECREEKRWLGFLEQTNESGEREPLTLMPLEYYI